VSANNDPQKIRTKEQLIAENFRDLLKHSVTVSEASERYKVLGRIPLSFILQDISFSKKHYSSLTGAVQSLSVFRQLRPEFPWCL